jgi:choline-glycine betaine transporter
LVLAGGIATAHMLATAEVDTIGNVAVVLALPGAYVLFSTMRAVVVDGRQDT